MSRHRIIVQSDNYIKSNLKLYYDAKKLASYSGSGIVVNDISGNSNHGNLVNGVGFSNNRFTFDGVNDYITTNNTLDLTATDKVTIQLLVKLLRFTGANIIYELSDNYSNYPGCFLVDIESNLLTMSIHSGTRTYNMQTATYSTDAILMTIIHDKTQSVVENIVYYNTTLQSTTNVTTANTINNFANKYLNIGARSGGTIAALMDLSAILVYTKRLTESEITTNYNYFKNRLW